KTGSAREDSNTLRAPSSHAASQRWSALKLKWTLGEVAMTDRMSKPPANPASVRGRVPATAGCATDTPFVTRHTFPPAVKLRAASATRNWPSGGDRLVTWPARTALVPRIE